jgi:hypothetical protein
MPDLPPSWFREKRLEVKRQHPEARQLAVANRQIREASRLNVVTGISVVIALIGTGAALWSVHEARLATIQANRAWVGLDGPIVVDEFRAGPIWGIALHYTVKNFGHGPALKVISSPFLTDDPKDEEGVANFVCKATENFSTGTVPMDPKVVNPGPLGHVLFPDQTAKIGDLISPDKRFVWHGAGSLADGKFVIAVGCVAYMDQFQEPHWTRFCMHGRVAHGQLAQWDFCNLYNDTDETGRHQSELFPIAKRN